MKRQGESRPSCTVSRAWRGRRGRCALLLSIFFLGATAADAQRLSTGLGLRVNEEPTIEDRFEDQIAGSGGYRAGGFLLRGQLSEELGWDDNVFVTNDKQGALASVTGGAASASSNWQRHQAFLGANAAFLALPRFPDQNAWVGNVLTGGRLDVTRDFQVGMDVLAGRQIDQRGDPDSIGAAAVPVIYQRYRVEPWLAANTGRFTHSASVQAETTVYENTEDANGASINLAAKEYEQVRGGYRLGYAYRPPFETYFRIEALDRSSTNNAGIPNQNFNIYGAAAGATVPITPVIAVLGELGVQYTTNDNPVIPDATVPTVGLSVMWEPTRSLRLEARAIRDFSASVVTGALQGSPGYIRTVVGLRAVSEIRHGLVATADAFFLHRDFIDDDTIQQGYGIDIGLRYALGRGIFVGAAYLYRYEENDSQISYSRNLFLTRISKSF